MSLEYHTVTKSEGASLVAQLVKNLPAMQMTLIQFLGQEDLLEKGYALKYSWASLVAQSATVHGVAKSWT